MTRSRQPEQGGRAGSSPWRAQPVQRLQRGEKLACLGSRKENDVAKSWDRRRNGVKDEVSRAQLTKGLVG